MYAKIYVNYNSILNTLKGNGQIPTRSLELALKYVLAITTRGEGYFDWKDFKIVSYDDFSKQYYLRLLNALVSLNILIVKEHKKSKLFKLDTERWKLYL